MVLVLLESITVVYGIPVDFLASWNRGCFFQTDSFCTATGRKGRGGEVNYVINLMIIYSIYLQKISAIIVLA